VTKCKGYQRRGIWKLTKRKSNPHERRRDCWERGRIERREDIPSEIEKNKTLKLPRSRSTKELRRILGLAGWSETS
jgi:hypothetical protein